MVQIPTAAEHGGRADPPLVAVAIVHYGSLEMTRVAVRSALATTYGMRTVMVVHNGTAPGSLPLREEFPEVVHVVVEENGGYGAGVNRAAEAASRAGAKYVYALNNDMELAPDALEPLVAACEADPRIGVLGGVHYYPDDRQRIQNSGCYIDWVTGAVRTPDDGDRDVGQLRPVVEPDFVCGAGVFAPVTLFRDVGGMDERFFLYCEESDWCLRVKASGRRVVRLAGSRLYHHGGHSVGAVRGLYQYYATRNKAWLVRRWAPRSRIAAFLVLHFLHRYPKMLAGRVVRRDWTGFRATLRGIVHGWTRSAA